MTGRSLGGRQTAAIGFLVIVLGASTEACGRAWERFEYPDCGFSVELPERPEEAFEALETPFGVLKVHVYYAGANSTVGDALRGGDFFLVYCAEGARSGGSDVLPYLERKVTGTLRGSIAQRSTIADGDYKGVELTIDGRSTKDRVRILEASGRVYALVADNSFLGRLAANAFLTSIRPI